jgi:hypothetical protein
MTRRARGCTRDTVRLALLLATVASVLIVLYQARIGVAAPYCSTNVLSSLLPAEEYSRGRSAPAARRTEMSVVMEALADPQLLMWGIAYLILKWTLGLWVLRRVRAWAKAKRAYTRAPHRCFT